MGAPRQSATATSNRIRVRRDRATCGADASGMVTCRAPPTLGDPARAGGRTVASAGITRTSVGAGLRIAVRDRNLVFGSRSRTSPSRFGFGAETDFRAALSEFAESPSGCQRRFGLLSLVRARFGLPGGRAGRQEARTGRLRRLFGRSEGLVDNVFLFHGGLGLGGHELWKVPHRATGWQTASTRRRRGTLHRIFMDKKREWPLRCSLYEGLWNRKS